MTDFLTGVLLTVAIMLVWWRLNGRQCASAWNDGYDMGYRAALDDDLPCDLEDPFAWEFHD